MTYLLAKYGFSTLLAALVGVVAGFSTFDCQRMLKQRWPLWHGLVVVLYGVGLAVALLKWLPGAPGLWLETALLLLTGWFVGLWLGGRLARLRCAGQTRRQQVEMPPRPREVVPIYPAAAAPVAADMRPQGLAAPQGGMADTLERINGIGPKNAQVLQSLGIYHFHQIAAWTPENIEWVSNYLDFPGRVAREDWVGQARRILKNPDFQAVPASARRGVDAGQYAGVKPDAEPLPEQGADDLTRIVGLDQGTAQILHALGIHRIAQIARWNADNVTWIDDYLDGQGRVTDQNWVAQAQALQG